MKVNKIDFEKTIQKLTFQELLSYETGVHLGDGSLIVDKNHRTYRIEYSGDTENDKHFYTKILPEILKKLYKCCPKIYLKSKERTLFVVINSKKVVRQKINLGLPVGNKRSLKEIPECIRENKKLVTHFIRGLADADFSLTFKKNRKGIYKEPRIEYFTNNQILANFVFSSLKELGFRCSLESAMRKDKFEEYRIRIYGKKHLDLWMRKIGFFNLKHLVKVIFYRKYGYYIPFITTSQRLELL